MEIRTSWFSPLTASLAASCAVRLTQNANQEFVSHSGVATSSGLIPELLGSLSAQTPEESPIGTLGRTVEIGFGCGPRDDVRSVKRLLAAFRADRQDLFGPVPPQFERYTTDGNAFLLSTSLFGDLNE